MGTRQHLAQGGRTSRCFQAFRQGIATAGQCGHCIIGQHPLAAARDADGGDVVPLGIERAQHVCCGDATDIVLGRLATKDDDHMGARVRIHSSPRYLARTLSSRMRFMATDVAHAVNGELRGKNAHLSGATFDSRTLVMGQLFVPIVADRDGHDFIPDALARGAGAHLTSRGGAGGAGGVGGAGAGNARGDDLRGTAIVVPDTLEALRTLGRWARESLSDRVEHRVVGITGSVGKTTTKDLAAAAIGSAMKVAASSRSFNNDQGVPITLLNAPDDCQALVLEMGMRGHGEITRLAEVGLPHIGIVTAVAEAHSALLHSLDGIARAKGELVEALPSSGVAILNADDDRVLAMQSRTSARVITFGEAPTATVA